MRPAGSRSILAGNVLVTTISGPTSTSIGQVITYIATTQNVTTVDATGVVVTIKLPIGLPLSTVSGGTYAPATGLVTFASTTVAVGTSLASAVSFLAQSTGTYTGKAASTASAANAEATLTDNDGSAANANLSTTVAGALCAPTTASIAKDGSPTNLGTAGPAGGLIVNTYFPSATTAQTLSVGATSIVVGTPTGAAPGVTAGDLLLIIQMQGADIDVNNTNTYGDGLTGADAAGYLVNANFTAGTYEYVVANSTLAAGASGTLTLASPLRNAYLNAAAVATTSGPRTFQVVRVPQYGNVTLAGNIGAAQWDGAKGGMVALEVAGKLTFAGFAITSAARGFRGGGGRALFNAPATTAINIATDNASAYGEKGESFAGTPQFVVYQNAALVRVGTDLGTNSYPSGGLGRGAPANGGGGTATRKGGGGGGGGAAAGGKGGYNLGDPTPAVDNRAYGGAAAAQISSSRLLMGGGGGAANNSDNVPLDAKTPAMRALFNGGAQGGGITIIRAGSVSGTGTVSASGNDSAQQTVSGGGIVVATGTPLSNVIEGMGGGGGGGTILVALRDATGLANITAANAGGAGGLNANTATTVATSATPSPAGPGGGGGGGAVIANGTFGTLAVAGGAAGTSQYGGTTVTFGATAGNSGVVLALPGSSTDGPVAADASGGAPGVAASADCEDAPAAANDAYITTPGTAITLSGAIGTATAGVLTNDADAVGGLDPATVDLDRSTAGVQQGTAGAPIAVSGGTAYVTATGQITFTPTAGFKGTALFMYTVSDIYGKNSNPALVRVTIEDPRFDLVTAISTTASLPAAGSLVPFTITATNNNATTAATAVVQTAQLQTGLTGTTLTVTGATASAPSSGIITYTGGTFAGATYNQTTGLLSFPAVTLTNGTPKTYTFSVAAPVNGPYNVTAQVANGTVDPVPANNTATAIVAITPADGYDLSTTITGPGTAPTAGDIVAYVVTAQNASGSLLASNVVQTVNIGLGNLGAYATNGGTYSSATGLVTFPAISLNSGQAVNNTVSFAAPVSGTTVQPVSTFTAASLVNDTNPANNSATAAALVTTAATGAPALGSAAASGTTANLRNTLTASAVLNAVPTNVAPGMVPVSQAVTYTATIINDGPSTAASVQELVMLPIGLLPATLAVTGSTGNTTLGNVITYTSGAGVTTVATYNTATGALGFPASPTLAAQATQQFVFTVTAPTSMLVLNASAVATTTTSDPVPSDNIATTQTNVQFASQVSTVLTGPSAALAGQPVVYNLTTTNLGTVSASSVSQTVAIPVGLLTSITDANGLKLNGNLPTSVNAGTGVATFTDGSTYVPATGLLTLPTLPTMTGGQVAQNAITYLVPASSVLTNVGAVQVGAPGNGGSTGTSSVSAAVSAASDVVVAVTGPTAALVGAPLTYAVTATNSGLSPTLAANTTAFIAQFPTGLPLTGTSPVKVNGQLPGAPAGTTVTYADGATYNSATGIVAFASIVGQAPGAAGARTNTVSFDAPDQASIALGWAANPANASNDLNLDNNSAVLNTTLTASSVPSADLVITLASDVATKTAGQPVIFTVTPSNASTSASAATNVRPQLNIPAGLAVSGLNPLVINTQTTPVSNVGTVFTYADGSQYYQSTGLVVLPVIATLAVGAAGTVSTVKVPAPGTGPLVAVASISASNAEANTANNTAVNTTATSGVAITPNANLVTKVSGPASSLFSTVVTYTVTTTNTAPATAGGAGGSPAAAAQQVITIPAGVATATPTMAGPGAVGAVITGSPAAGFTVTLALGTLYVGLANAVSNTVSFSTASTAAAPNPYSITGTGSSTTAGAAPSPGTQATTEGPTGPTADDLVNAGRAGFNAAQQPIGNTAIPVAITSLAAIPSGSATISTYSLTTFPDPTKVGTLYVNGVAVTAPRTLTPAEALLLTFDPLSSFVGNAFFLFTATDNGALTSNVARYTIPVNQDVPGAYANTPTKPLLSSYVNGDVITNLFDVNGGSTAPSGTVTNNGVRAATYSAFTSSPSGAIVTLADLSLVADLVTGQITVFDKTKLMNGSFTLNVTTTDAYNGVMTQPVTFIIGTVPLPVELTAFEAKAVRNTDALLTWRTASERSNDHFDVERSLNGTDFAKIGLVKGQGNKTTPTDYSLTDTGIGVRAMGRVYYRLRQFDTDGTTTYSPVRTVAFTQPTAPGIALYPNPSLATTITQLDLSQLPAGAYRVSVLDATGRVALHATLDAGLTHAIDLRLLASGAYVVLVRSEDGGQLINLAQRLVKN
ncbi:Ig-like domain-containing protein [Hymenobacter terricola]|uniref:Ig-like domain-containing protein n=1 Tax=Hymenobacter terricola TaxID=2819236 RepID=UPI001CF29C30|nr:Ig-like domain-containing protein [Hymenobacter terricola]